MQIVKKLPNIEKTEEIKRIKENITSIFVPMSIKKRSNTGATIILPDNIAQLASHGAEPNYDQKLINAFVKAYKWQQSLNNNSMTINKIAAKETVSISYVSRLLRLNFIAPEIVRAIIDGKQPSGLKLKDFINKTIPDLWEEQKETFGFI